MTAREEMSQNQDFRRLLRQPVQQAGDGLGRSFDTVKPG
jgi:hypothetical protein